MSDNLKDLLKNWSSLDGKTKLIYGVIAIILVLALIFGVGSLSGGDAKNEPYDDISTESETDVVIDDDDVSSADIFDPAQSSTDADAGGDDEEITADSTTTTEPTTEKTTKTSKTKKTTTTTEKTKKTTTTTEKTTTTTEQTKKTTEQTKKTTAASKIDKNGTYSSRDEVAEYLATYKQLPSNYITKNEAEDLGWIASKGNLATVAPGKSIGGDNFSNREGRLPKKSGRKYYECDIDYVKGTRNAKRIIFSNDGLIFYTQDHYETFTQYDPETKKWN